MSKPRASTLGIPAAVFAAAAITILSVWLLSMLNARAMPSVPAPHPTRTVMIRAQPDSTFQRPQRKPRPNSTPQPPAEKMTALSELPTTAPLILPPLDLNLELLPPEIDSVSITIHQPPVKPLELLRRDATVNKVVAEITPKRTMETALPASSATPMHPELVRPSRSTLSPTRSTTSIARSPSAQISPTAATTTSAGPIVHRADRVDQPPREGYGNPQPAYPIRERNLGIEGSVLLRLLIDEQGKVKDAKVLRGPEAFRKPVLAVVFDWQFTPAQHQGSPVKVWGVKEVQFRLRTQYR